MSSVNIYGYAGKILRVNLDHGEVAKETISPETLRSLGLEDIEADLRRTQTE